MKEMETQSKPSLKLQAYQYLKTKILNCEYRPNEFLNEQKLCAEMGNISRTPMRDALGRLEQEGLITILPKKGLMVMATASRGKRWKTTPSSCITRSASPTSVSRTTGSMSCS